MDLESNKTETMAQSHVCALIIPLKFEQLENITAINNPTGK